MKRKIIYISIIAVLITVVISYVYPKQTFVHQKCPEAYTEDVVGTTEYRNAITGWTSEFFKDNPKATMADWSKAKTQLWVENNCAVAIQRSKLSGKVSDLKPWERVDYEIQNALDKVAY